MSEEYAKDITDVLIDDIEAAFVKAGIKIGRGDVAMLVAFAVATAKDISFPQEKDVKKDDTPMSFEDIKKTMGEPKQPTLWGDGFWWVMLLFLFFGFAPFPGSRKPIETTGSKALDGATEISRADLCYNGLPITPVSDKEYIAYLNGKVEAYEKTLIGG